jgi:hypothetical protein
MAGLKEWLLCRNAFSVNSIRRSKRTRGVTLRGGRGGQSWCLQATAADIAAPAVVSGPPVMRSPEQWDAAGFAATEMARPLRRGGEVHRFSELAAHEDQLPPEDAEELYRFRIRRVLSRLRQLAPSRTRGDLVLHPINRWTIRRRARRSTSSGRR